MLDVMIMPILSCIDEVEFIQNFYNSCQINIHAFICVSPPMNPILVLAYDIWVLKIL